MLKKRDSKIGWSMQKNKRTKFLKDKIIETKELIKAFLNQNSNICEHINCLTNFPWINNRRKSYILRKDGVDIFLNQDSNLCEQIIILINFPWINKQRKSYFSRKDGVDIFLFFYIFL